MVYTRSPSQYSANQLLRSSIVSTKGLLNGPGQNNCFLNCAVQVSFIQFTQIFHFNQDSGSCSFFLIFFLENENETNLIFPIRKYRTKQPTDETRKKIIFFVQLSTTTTKSESSSTSIKHTT